VPLEGAGDGDATGVAFVGDGAAVDPALPDPALLADAVPASDMVPAADTALVDPDADGMNEGLRSLLAADVPFSAEAAGALDAEAEEVADASDDSASPFFCSVSQLLSPELIACRLPCRSLLRPLSPADSDELDEPADRPLGLPMVSAGSGTVVLDPAASSLSFLPSSRRPSTFSEAAGASSTGASAVAVATSPGVAPSLESPEEEVAVSPEEEEEEESPLASLTRRDAADRELPALVRDDDMMPLSTIASAVSPSGSAFRLGGAMMSGG